MDINCKPKLYGKLLILVQVNKNDTNEKLTCITFKVLFIIRICKLVHLHFHENPLSLILIVHVLAKFVQSEKNIAVYEYFFFLYIQYIETFCLLFH